MIKVFSKLQIHNNFFHYGNLTEFLLKYLITLSKSLLIQIFFSDSECSESCSQCSSHSYTGSEDESSTSSKAIKTNPPPLPRVPLPPHPSILTVSVNQNDTYTPNSIRPNLHQYLERDNTIWGKTVHDDSYLNNNYKRELLKPIHPQNIRWNSVDNVLNVQRTVKSSQSHGTLRLNPGNSVLSIPRSQDERISAHFKHLFQTELRGEANCDQLNSNVPSSNINFNERYRQDNFGAVLKTEKNKVKFSDTVTIAVVPVSQNLCLGDVIFYVLAFI